MSSTYSTNLAIELIGTGDQAGVWGNTTNTNLGTLIEQAISGYVTQAVATGTDTTITIPNGATGVARNMYIELTGTGGASTNLIVPANKKLYFIFNNSTGAVTVKVLGQTGVSVPQGKKMVLVCNGTDIVNGLNYIADFGTNSFTVTNLTATSATITTLTATSSNITTLTGSTQTLSGNLTLSGGTANGVLYLNGSKVATSGSALTFDGTNLQVGATPGAEIRFPRFNDNAAVISIKSNTSVNELQLLNNSGGGSNYLRVGNGYLSFGAEASEGMRLTSTGLGIGTASPSQKLTITGNILLLQGADRSVQIGSSTNYRYDLAAVGDDFQIIEAGTTPRFVIRYPSGNVGIGTTSPTYRIDALLGAGSGNIARFGQSGVSNGYTITTNGSALTHEWANGGSVSMAFTSSGNLGIGTASPSRRLHVVAADGVTNSLFAGATFALRTQSIAGVGTVLDAVAANESTYQPLVAGGSIFAFQTGGTERMRLDASGNLGIGTASPAYRLDVVDAGGNALRFGTSTVQMGGFVSAGLPYLGTISNHSLALMTNSVERMRITNAGNIVAGASAALATTATDGFLYVPTCAGTPTGTPTAITGMAPIVVNTTNNKLYFYSGGAWRDAGP